MGWYHTFPQPHLKIKNKDLMPLAIFKEERKGKMLGKRKEGKRKGKKEENRR